MTEPEHYVGDPPEPASTSTPIRMHRALSRLEASGDQDLEWLALQVRHFVAGDDRELAGVSAAAWRAFLFASRNAELREAHAMLGGSLDELVVAIELFHEAELEGELHAALARAAAFGVGLPRRRSSVADALKVRSTTNGPDSRSKRTEYSHPELDGAPNDE